MDIKDFLKDTLVQIATGVKEANEELAELDSFVASSNANGENLTYTTRNKIPHYVSNIDFDIAVTVSSVDTKKKGAKFGISVVGLDLGVGAGTEHKGETQNQAISKIKFSLPLALPTEPK